MARKDREDKAVEAPVVVAQPPVPPAVEDDAELARILRFPLVRLRELAARASFRTGRGQCMGLVEYLRRLVFSQMRQACVNPLPPTPEPDANQVAQPMGAELERTLQQAKLEEAARSRLATRRADQIKQGEERQRRHEEVARPPVREGAAR